VTPLLAFLLVAFIGLAAAVIVARATPSSWWGFLLVFGLVAAAIFVFARWPPGSWARLGADVAVVALAVGWIAGFAGIALVRAQRHAEADRPN